MSKLNILIAYPYFKKNGWQKLLEKERNDYSLIVDSGAFTAYNSKKEITYNGYSNFLKEIKQFKPNACVQLDVVFNPQKTKENFQRHLNDGHDVCPVFTRGDDFEYLEQLIEKNYYVFVGGVQKGEEASTFAKKILTNYSEKKIHLLAFVRKKWINYYKPYSTDSSTHSCGGRFGILYLYDRNISVTSKKRNHFIKKPSKKIFQLFENIGLDSNHVKQFAKQETWSGKNGFLNFVNALSYIKYSIETEKKYGTKIYLATEINSSENLFKAYYYLKDAKLI